MKKILAILTAVALLAALAVPALAETFVPSIYEKDVPPTTDSAIVMRNGDDWDEDYPITEEDYTVLTLDQCFHSEDDEIRDTVDWVYSELAGAGDMFEVAPELEDAMFYAGIPLTEETKQNYVIRDMFYIQYDGELNDDQAFKTCFELQMNPGDFLYVMVNVDGWWTVVPAENVTINPLGQVEVVLQEFGAIAFVVERGE